MAKTQEIEIKKEITPVIEKVQALSITSQADMNPAVEMLSQVNKVLDKLTEEKEKLTKPLNATLKEIRSRYKPMEDMLEQAVASIKSKMQTYQMQALAEQRKQEEKIANDLLSGKIKKNETAIRKMSEIEAPEEKVHTDEGSVGFRPIKKFEVMDIVMLANASPEAVVPNDIFIRKQMNAGIELAGVRYFEELSVVNKR